MEEIEYGILRFEKIYGVGRLRKIIMPRFFYHLFAEMMAQRYPNIECAPGDVPDLIFMQKGSV